MVFFPLVSKRNVVHVEIPAADVQAASKFYQELFGWKMQHAAEFDYTMWEDGSGYGGGFNKVPMKILPARCWSTSTVMISKQT